LRQEYRAGEKMFADYARTPVPVIVNARTGEARAAAVFVCVLGASSYTYAEVTWDRTLPNWIGSHVRAFEFFGGCARLETCDNLRTGVIHACRYEPDLNPTFQDLATHYGFGVIPSRVRRPRDNAKAEAAVQLVTRWILARLRKHVFFSLGEVNRAIRDLNRELNEHPFRKKPGSRRSLYEELDRPALLPLPANRFVFCEWKKATVNIDYHVELLHHYYSVPYQHVHEKVRIRFTAETVEVFRDGRRIAAHLRDDTPGRYTTNPEHLPRSHREYLEWSPSRILRWGEKIGPATSAVLKYVLQSRMYPEQGYRPCLGILRLADRYTEARLEAACQRALAIRGCSYKSVRSILESGLDARPVASPAPEPPIPHDNIRGGGYYTPDEPKEHAHVEHAHA
jgi:transposase